MKDIVPIYINNRNRLSSTLGLVDYLLDVPNARPIIVDNASTYAPLLAWYRLDHGIEIVRAEKNLGPRAPWLIGHALMKECAYYVVTDSDLDLNDVPRDVLAVLRSGLEKYPDRVKAGLSLEINDLPPQFESTTLVQAWEAKYWRQRLDERWFAADVDTTFALYRSGTKWPGLRPALRADRPYVARHWPWYRLDTSEDRYHDRHTDPRWTTWANWTAPISTQPARAQHLQALNDEKRAAA